MSAVFMYIFSGIIISMYNTPKITYYYQGYSIYTSYIYKLHIRRMDKHLVLKDLYDFILISCQ